MCFSSRCLFDFSAPLSPPPPLCDINHRVLHACLSTNPRGGERENIKPVHSRLRIQFRVFEPGLCRPGGGVNPIQPGFSAPVFPARSLPLLPLPLLGYIVSAPARRRKHRDAHPARRPAAEQDLTRTGWRWRQRPARSLGSHWKARVGFRGGWVRRIIQWRGRGGQRSSGSRREKRRRRRWRKRTGTETAGR